MPYLGNDTDNLLQTPPFLDPILARRMAQTPAPNPGMGADPGDVAPPDESQTGVAPPPGQPPASVASPNPDLQAYKEAQARLSAAKSQVPPTPKPKWYQRLGAAALGGAAGYVNASGKRMAPIDASKGEQAILNGIGYGQKVAEYNRNVQQAQAGVDEAQSNLGAGKVVAETGKDEAQGRFYGEENQRAKDVANIGAQQRQATAQASQRERTMTQLLKGRESIGYQRMGQPVPQGYEAIPDITTIDPATGMPQYVHIVTPATVQLSQDHMDSLGDFLKGRKTGDIIPYSEWSAAQKAANQYHLEKLKETGKPPTAESDNLAYQNTVGKAMQAGLLHAADINDPNKVDAALQKAQQTGVLTPQEATQARAHAFSRTTPTTNIYAGTERAIAYGQNRIGGYIDTKTGQMFSMNAADVNMANQQDPGRYVPAQQALPQMGKTGIFRSMHYTIGNARKAISALDSFDAGTRAELATALKDTTPEQALTRFLQGTAATTMNAQQKEAVMSLQLLAEDMMALRSVAGMGQGSDLMREAILNTIPSARTPDKGYALRQLDKVEQLVTNLQSGTAGLGQPTNIPPNAPTISNPNRRPLSSFGQ